MAFRRRRPPIRILLPSLLALVLVFGLQVAPLRAQAEGDVLIEVDNPVEGGTVPPGFQLSGWAANRRAATGTGLDSVHAYLDGPAGQGARLGGAAFTPRPDVAEHFGRPDWARAGFRLDVEGVAPGPHRLYIYAFDSASNERPLKVVNFTASWTVAPPRFPRVSAPPEDQPFPCLRANPSCGRDEWWAEFNQLQRNDLVEYRFAPGLITESRFIEAIWLIWLWPEGKELIRAAAENGVLVVTIPGLQVAFAGYSPSANTIFVSGTFTEVSTWMLADILAHELMHASDDRARRYEGRTYDECIAREQGAYHVERRFLQWLATRMGGLPSVAAVWTTLSPVDFLTFVNLLDIATSPDLNVEAIANYRKVCTDSSLPTATPTPAPTVPAIIGPVPNT